MEQLAPIEINKPELGVTGLAGGPGLVGEEPQRSHSKEYTINEMKEEPSKIKIDFFQGEKPNDFIKAPTQTANPIPASDNPYINPSTQPGINALNPGKSKEEIRGSMAVLIAILDYAASFMGQMLAGEGTQSQYTADTPQKKILENALTDYFYEKQVKMSPGVTLLLAFLSAYGFMFVQAAQKRFKLIQDNRKGIKKTIPPAFQKGGLSKEDIKKIQNENEGKINDVNNISHIDVTYVEQNGEMKEKNIPKWLNPDPKIIALNRKELEMFLSKGIYPMFLKNKNNTKHRKIKYNPVNGKPVLIGKPPRVQ